MTPPRPLVSAAIATYRRPDVLPRAIHSVLEQTVADVEVVVVDDEPSEVTRAVVESFGLPNVRYVAHETNKGLAAARNTGVREARGEFVGFLDDDDEWAPEKVERQLEAMRRHGGNVVVTCFERWIRPSGRERTRAIRLDGDVHRTLLDTDMVLMQTLLLPRRAIEEVGWFDEALTNYMDMDMAIRLSRRFRFVTVPQPLFIGHETPGSLSRNEANRIRALERILDKYPEYRNDRRLRSRWIYRLARKHAALGDSGAWRRRMLEALRLNPFNVRAAVMLAAGVIAGPDFHVGASRKWGRWKARRRARNA